MRNSYLRLFVVCALWTRLVTTQEPVATTRCEFGFQLALFVHSLDFNAAKQVCVDNQATLARISNTEEHNTTVRLMLEFGAEETEFWFGNSQDFMSVK